MANMKQIYLVQFEEYSDGFCAFESYGNAYDFARTYLDSMPGQRDGVADMIREVFLLDAGRECPEGKRIDTMADVDAELDCIGRETEEYWRSRNEQ